MSRRGIRQLARDVAAIRGETLSLDCEPSESPFPDMEERVRLLAPGVLQKLVLEAEADTLSGLRQLTGTVEIDDAGCATLDLPDDFLRLIMVKMSDWEQAAREITEHSDLKAALGSSRWEGIRGNRQRPVVTTGYRANGRRCLRLYSSGAGAILETALYYPIPKVADDDTLEIPDILYHPLLEKLAAALFPDG